MGRGRLFRLVEKGKDRYDHSANRFRLWCSVWIHSIYRGGLAMIDHLRIFSFMRFEFIFPFWVVEVGKVMDVCDGNDGDGCPNCERESCFGKLTFQSVSSPGWVMNIWRWHRFMKGDCVLCVCHWTCDLFNENFGQVLWVEGDTIILTVP